jgi:hypothetical protein
VPVLVWENNETVLKNMRWGLIPSWSKDETIADKLTNARAETLTEKPSFKKPFQTQRCLIPADGYFEWQRSLLCSNKSSLSGCSTLASWVINATMDIAAAKQLLRNSIAAAKTLGVDANLQKKWAELISKMPPYEVGPDGSFREWLWPGLPENNRHRHASHFYALYDGMPSEIVDDPALVKAVGHSIGERVNFLEATGVQAFGFVQNGLAAAHTGNSEYAQRIINYLARHFWSAGMGSFHNRDELFNMDISGGFPYLCASTLVYADPGVIKFFPARPPQWQSGSLKGVRLRGGIVIRALTWDGAKAKAVLVSDTNQTVTIETPDGKTKSCNLRAGVATSLDL